jgi:hypothetical protein
MSLGASFINKEMNKSFLNLMEQKKALEYQGFFFFT